MSHFDYVRANESSPVVLRKPYLTLAGVLRDEPGYHSEMHFHETDTELMYVAEGEGLSVVEGITFPMSAGDLIIYQPGFVHNDQYSSSMPSTQVYFIRFRNYHIAGLNQNRLLAEGGQPIVQTGIYRRQCMAYFAGIYEECAKHEAGYDMLVNNYLQALFLLVIRLISTANGHVVLQDTGALACRAKDYIDHNYDKPIGIANVAEHLHVSHYHLTHAFRETIRTSPKQYLTDRRVSEARRLLAGSDMSILTIAQSVGYERLSQFDMHFKKQTGTTPRRYREENKGKEDHKVFTEDM